MVKLISKIQGISCVFKVIKGDAYTKLNELQLESVDVCFTSPGPPGSEPLGHVGGFNKPETYVFNLATIFDKVRHVLKKTGSLWVQMGDTHDATGSLKLIPEQFVVRMREKGWIVRSKLIWHREGETYQEDETRFIRDWEYLYWFVLSTDYYYKEPIGFFKKSVYSFAPETVKDGEFKTIFPEQLVGLALATTCPPDGLVLDPFSDSGVTGVVAMRHGHSYIGIEIDGDKVIKQLARLSSTK